MSVSHPEKHETTTTKPAGEKTTSAMGPQEEAAAEAKKTPAPAPKAAPEPAAAPPPTFKDANGNDVAVGDQVMVTATVLSVSPDDNAGGGNVALETAHTISPTSDEKALFNLKTACVEGQGPAPGTKKDDKKPATPAGGSTDTPHAQPAAPTPSHTAAQSHAKSSS